MHAYTTSINKVWLINTPILGVGLLLGASTALPFLRVSGADAAPDM